MNRYGNLPNLTLVTMTTISGILLMGFQNHLPGWMLLAVTTLATLIWRQASIRRHLLLILLSLAILGITPINTDIDARHFAVMAGLLSLTVIIPYMISRYVYRETFLHFPMRVRHWSNIQTLYILITATLAYLFLPYYLISTGSYLNWTVEPGFGNLLILFIGTNGLGIWDELFFVTIVLALLQRHIPFWFANIAQSLLWTAFLYELGFQGWAPLFLIPFTLSQGYIFRKTNSLTYILAIHLTLDLILYLALIHAHHPDWMPIFLFSPHV